MKNYVFTLNAKGRIKGEYNFDNIYWAQKNTLYVALRSSWTNT